MAEETDTGNDGPVFDMNQMVITGTRTEHLVSEAPVKTELFVQEDFDDYNISSLKDTFKLIPTCRFESDCQNCGLNQIQLLGLSTDYTAILFDGAPLYCGLAKVYGADLFPSVFIDRIEVVKGGSSVLYGAEAMAGVVNLITEEPTSNHAEMEVSFQSWMGDASEWETSFKADQVGDGFAWRAYAYFDDRDGLDLGTDGFTEIPEFENKVIGFQSWVHPLDGATFKSSFQYMDQAHRGGDQLELPEEEARVAESLAHQVWMANLDWTQLVSDSFDYSFKASYMEVQRKSFYGARADNEQRAYEQAGYVGDVTEDFIVGSQDLIYDVARSVWGLTNNSVYYLDLQFNHYLNEHTLSYGAQYRNEDLEDGSLYDSSAEVTNDSFYNFGVFVQDQWEISEKLELVSGLRIDEHGNVDGRIFSPRLAARYFATDELTLRVSWSTGFNAPGAFNEDMHIGVNNGGAIFLVNSDDLQEESSQTFSVGAEFKPNTMDGRLALHSQVHYTLLDDTFEIDDSGELSGDENLWLRVNGPSSEILVWENNLNYQLDAHWRIDAGLSYIYARLDDPVERLEDLVTEEYLKRPDWTGHFGLSYENHEFVDGHVFLSYTGSMLAVGEDAGIWRDTPDFFVVDLGLSKEFEDALWGADLVVSAGIDNLFDERQKDFFNNGEERDPTYLYGPTEPRTYYVTLKMLW